jgi:hypothetical protein
MRIRNRLVNDLTASETQTELVPIRESCARALIAPRDNLWQKSCVVTELGDSPLAHLCLRARAVTARVLFSHSGKLDYPARKQIHAFLFSISLPLYHASFN